MKLYSCSAKLSHGVYRFKSAKLLINDKMPMTVGILTFMREDQFHAQLS